MKVSDYYSPKKNMKVCDCWLPLTPLPPTGYGPPSTAHTRKSTASVSPRKKRKNATGAGAGGRRAVAQKPECLSCPPYCRAPRLEIYGSFLCVVRMRKIWGTLADM